MVRSTCGADEPPELLLLYGGQECRDQNKLKLLTRSPLIGISHKTNRYHLYLLLLHPLLPSLFFSLVIIVYIAHHHSQLHVSPPSEKHFSSAVSLKN